MNKITRVLTMSGIGLVAAVMMAGPAQASGTSAQPVTKSAAGQSDKAQQHDREYVAGYFSSLRSCEREGRRGVWDRRWYRYDCDLVPFGIRSGLWRLEVERGFRSNGWSIGHRGSDHRIGHRGSDHRIGHRGSDHRIGHRGSDHRNGHTAGDHRKHNQHKNDGRGGRG